MAEKEYIERGADRFKYYIVRNKITGEYFRGKGVNKWGKYYNQASIYRFRKHAENAVEEETRRGRPSEVIEIRITSADVVEVVRCKDCKHWKQVTAERHACCMIGFEMDYDEYCSCGERKE